MKEVMSFFLLLIRVSG